MGSPRRWGSGDMPLCPKCGKGMFVTRRTPHAEYTDYEQQTLTCACGEEIERSADVQGKPYGLER